MKQLNITGTRHQLVELLERLDEDYEAKIDSGHVPIRPDLTLEIVLREDDDADEVTYDLTEV